MAGAWALAFYAAWAGLALGVLPPWAFLAIGLPAFVLIKVFQPAFFAREDTKTPMWFAGISMFVNDIPNGPEVSAAGDVD